MRLQCRRSLPTWSKSMRGRKTGSGHVCDIVADGEVIAEVRWFAERLPN